MKVKEARKLWCPFVRFKSTNSPASFNRQGANSSIPDESLCVADLCMAWRWHLKLEHVSGDLIMGIPDSGYCGMAGPSSNDPRESENE